MAKSDQSHTRLFLTDEDYREAYQKARQRLYYKAAAGIGFLSAAIIILLAMLAAGSAGGGFDDEPSPAEIRRECREAKRGRPETRTMAMRLVRLVDTHKSPYAPHITAQAVTIVGYAPPTDETVEWVWKACTAPDSVVREAAKTWYKVLDENWAENEERAPVLRTPEPREEEDDGRDL